MPAAPKKEAPKKALTGLAAFREKMGKTYGTQLTRQETHVPKPECISTGLLGLDYATVCGGWVEGRLHLIWGQEGVGKSTLCYLAMAEAQRKHPDKAVVYIDMEQTFDFEYAAKWGLDLSEDRFFHLYPDNSEDVADMLKDSCRSGVVSMVTVDSVGGMETKKAIDKSAGESDMGKNSQVITRMCKVGAVEARKEKVAVLIISQVRANFASMTGGDTYAAPKALRHATSMVIQLKPVFGDDTRLTIKVDGEDIEVGRKIAAKIQRSKMAPQGRTAHFWIKNMATEAYGPVGIDPVDDAITLALKPSVGAIEQQGGGYYVLPDGNRVRGRKEVLAYLREVPELIPLIREKALASVSVLLTEEKPELEFVQGDEDVEESA